MDTVDLQASSNESFLFMQDISAWSQLYDLRTCAFKSQMRTAPGDPLVLYEWSFANNNMTIFLTPATGTFNFLLNPTPLDTVLLGTTSVQFVGSSPVGNQVLIAGTLPATVTNFITFAGTSTDAAISSCTYSNNGNLVTASYKVPGGMGNSFPISASNALSIVASGTTLLGGVAILQEVAARPSVVNFSGDYSYDMKLYFQGSELDMFGGKLTFIPGVTL